MDWWQDPNPWVLTICGGIIVTVVGGLMLHFLLTDQGVTPSGCSFNARLFLGIQLTIVAFFFSIVWLAQDFHSRFYGSSPQEPGLLSGLVVFFVLASVANLVAAIIGYENLGR
jgi:uncharacterized PurR-regulated membrane protein YhhQ (DUF165 family)